MISVPSPGEPEPSPTEGEPKQSELLRDYSRYLDLLAKELEALELEDAPRLRELDAERARLEAEMEKECNGPPPQQRLAEQLAEVLGRLEEWSRQDRTSRDRLASLHDRSLPLMREFRSRPPGGSYHAVGMSDTQLDVRF